MSLDVDVRDDVTTMRVRTSLCDVTIEVVKREVEIGSPWNRHRVVRFLVQPAGALEPWSRHIEHHTAFARALSRARRIERSYLKLERTPA